jgi:hypothetical protein
MALPEIAEASLFLLDFHLGSFASPLDEHGRKDPARDPSTAAYCRAFYRGIVELARAERKRQEQRCAPRRFVLLGHQNTLFEEPLQRELSITLGGFAGHVHHGTVKPAASARPPG